MTYEGGPAQMLSDHLTNQVTLNTVKAQLALGREVRIPLDHGLKELELNREELVSLLRQVVKLNPNLLRGLTFKPYWVHEFDYGEWQVVAQKKG